MLEIIVATTNRGKFVEIAEALKGLPSSRKAAFVCAMVLITPEGKEIMTEGRCEGEITLEPRGTHGFGYDPVFWIPSLGKTTAELSLEEKTRISHRGRALQRLRGDLQNFLK